ncbi:inositol monophosphatase family protein [Botryobacter ruber]|uniref:inositol monophosphatase family protein n=1 Tax=Botryobacter ruber TaxID=2171629 RepID=UPI000E0B8889|nr:inositol monophosphatase family protein [Botryobacter ruber]
MNLEHLSQKLNTVARKVGEFIRYEAENFDRGRIELKGFNNLVSYVDKEAEVQLVAALRELLPEAGFITEEGTDSTQQERYNWVIDPVDGTTNFTHGLPIFCISVGLMEYNEVVAGVVYDMSRDECFYAWKDGGAYLNGKPIRVSEAPALKDALIATGFPYREQGLTQQYMQILMSFLAKSHGFRRLGSAAIDLAYVAAGRFEAFFEYNLNPWDVAAGVLLIKEAGGKISTFTDLNGDYLFGGEIAASNGHIHSEVMETISEFWKKA